MKGRGLGLAGILLLCLLCAQAGERTYKYRVTLADKAETIYSLDEPEKFLSARSLERRQRQGIRIDSTDLPVCESYIHRLVEQGGKYLSSSKWNNTVLLQTSDEAAAGRFLENSFVKSVKKVWVSPDTVFPPNRNRKKEVKNVWSKRSDYYGAGAGQIKMHRGDSLHAAGFRGKGMQIADHTQLV